MNSKKHNVFPILLGVTVAILTAIAIVFLLMGGGESDNDPLRDHSLKQLVSANKVKANFVDYCSESELCFISNTQSNLSDLLPFAENLDSNQRYNAVLLLREQSVLDFIVSSKNHGDQLFGFCASLLESCYTFNDTDKSKIVKTLTDYKNHKSSYVFIVKKIPSLSNTYRSI